MISVTDTLRAMRSTNEAGQINPCDFSFVKANGELVHEKKCQIIIKSKNSELPDFNVPYMRPDGEVRQFFYKALTRFNGQPVYI